MVEMQLSVGDAIGESKVGPIPDMFGRVEFRGISREELCIESWVLLKEWSDGMLTMNRSPIPQQDNRPTQMSEEIPQEDFNVVMFEVMRSELHVQSQAAPVGRNADGPKSRDPVLLEPMVEVRCLSPWCPCTPEIGDEQKSTFIHEYEMGATSCGFFLFGATPSAPNGQWPLRPFGALGARVSDSSIPCSVTVARHGLDDRLHESVS